MVTQEARRTPTNRLKNLQEALKLLLSQKIPNNLVNLFRRASEVVVFLVGEDDKSGVRYSFGQDFRRRSVSHDDIGIAFQFADHHQGRNPDIF
jgi:hypothetical protein